MKKHPLFFKILIFLLLLLVIGMIRSSHKAKQEKAAASYRAQMQVSTDTTATKEATVSEETLSSEASQNGESDFSAFYAPSNDPSDYQWANDYERSEDGTACYVLDGGQNTTIFGKPVPTCEELVTLVDTNSAITDEFKPFVKNYIQTWLELWPESDLSVFRQNLSTLCIDRVSAKTIQEKAGSSGTVACYINSENRIYVSEDLELSDPASDDCIVLTHELTHAVRNGAFTKDAVRYLFRFSYNTMPGQIPEEALITLFAHTLQGRMDPAGFYTVPCNFFRIILDCLGDSYSGTDYVNHSVNLLADRMDAYMGEDHTSWEILWQLSCLYESHNGETIDNPPADYDLLLSYITRMYCKKYLSDGMPSSEAEEVFHALCNELTTNFDRLITPYDEITPEALRPYFEACCKKMGVSD